MIVNSIDLHRKNRLLEKQVQAFWSMLGIYEVRQAIEANSYTKKLLAEIEKIRSEIKRLEEMK